MKKLFPRIRDAYRAIKLGTFPPRNPALAAFFGAQDEDTGLIVTPETSMQVAAVWSAIRLLAESVGILPLFIYRRVQAGGKERDPNHPLFNLLHATPNVFQTIYEFKEMMQIHVLLRGNAYAEIIPTGGRGVSQLIPLHPDRVRPFHAPDGRRAYEFTPLDGPTRILLQNEVLHIMGLSSDGLKGLNPIEHHRRSIGLSIGAEKYGARFFKNDAKPGVILEHPGRLTTEGRQNLRESWERMHRGVDRAHKTAILEEGLKAREMGMNPQDAQFLETRKFQVTDIARIFRVPPHMIGDLEKATFSNIEEQSLEFVVYNLTPWLVRWEQAVMRDLFAIEDRKTHLAEFLVDALLRGDIEGRFKAYAIARQWGWLSANDIRAIENLNPIKGGNIYLVPLNMIPATTLRSIWDGEDEPETRKDLLRALIFAGLHKTPNGQNLATVKEEE